MLLGSFDLQIKRISMELYNNEKRFCNHSCLDIYLSSICASRYACPHLRPEFLLEHFLVNTNPPRKPTRRETKADAAHATDRVFSE